MDKEVTRWLVQIDDEQWLLYDDEQDVEEWDTILEITLPAEMALMLDFTQHSYHTMQRYFQAQWAIMQAKLDEDAGIAPGPMDGDSHTFDKLFEGIIKNSRLDELGKEEE